MVCAAGSFVNTPSVHPVKLEALRAHKSQQSWLKASQKLNSYLQLVEDNSLRVGAMSKKFENAEGWRRHLHFGFCAPNADPLADLANDYVINKEYERRLENV